ncbi:TonB-dependent receptor domain-containing protein [Sphingobium sp. WCS2017Hpa-17]|uniref:TonB-dependent receptor domain-containing protein n=1 Tax=Sphingobium sp. WCS2017Hpa-17 TaxID=3073638 RepID=UPI00288C2625|nr:TonB-dependent receptor [Sphingobium sp. WCS2017Hpa-17]
MPRTALRHSVSRSVLMLLALSAAPALAQEGAAPQDDQGAADIIVTGTSIRGVAPVGSPLVAVGRAEIEQSAATTTIRILQETPQILNYGVSDTTRSGAGGASNVAYGNSINLRGVGPYATLTLINGHRAVPQGTAGNSVDPSTIPTLALERVEVIADGASAIYGSDAVAGVANLILRRKYEGLEVEVQNGFADHYRESQIGVIGGHKWDTGQITASFQHTYRTNLSGLHRDFYGANLTDRGGADYRVTQCAPGNIVTGGTSYAIPAGGATPDTLVAGTSNKCDNLKAIDLVPQQEINSAALTFDQDITDGIRFYADVYAARRDAQRRGQTAAQNLTVPRSNAYFVAPAGTNPASETVQYSFANDFGPYSNTDITSKTIQGTAGINADLFGDWQIDVYGTIGDSRDHVRSHGNLTDSAALTAALASSDPATAFNPFGTSANNQNVIDAIMNNVTDTRGHSKMRAAEVTMNGTLFSLPGGDVKVAVGAEYYKLNLRTGQVRGRVGAQTGTDLSLGRNVKSAYLELMVPIFGPDNAIPGFQRLDLDIAGRIDDYSDVGVTKNPKIGINWEPVRNLKLHGSYGESFRAPLLTQLISAGGTQMYIQNYFDPTVGTTVQGVALSGGNLNLKPETARTWSFGGEYSPDFLPGAQLSLNYFDLVYKGQINGYLSNLNVLRQENLYSSIILRDAAAQARIAELIAQGLTINGGTTANAQAATVFVEGRPSNLGTTITRGIDFGLSVPVRTGNAGDFRFSVRGTHFLTYKVGITPDAPVIDQVNNIDYPLKWRARGVAGWSKGGFDGSIVVAWQNGYNNTYVTPVEKIKSYTTVDLRLAYDLSETGIPGTEGVKVGLDVQNLFDRDPPFADLAPTSNGGGGGFDPQTTNAIGRMVSLSISKSF